MNIGDFISIMDYFGDPFHVGTAMREIVVAITVFSFIIGLAQALFGYKLIRFWITLQGIAVGGVIGLLAGAVFGGRGSAGAMVGWLVGAVLGGWLAYTFYKVGVFIQCFAVGFLVVSAVVLYMTRGQYQLAAGFGLIVGTAVGIFGVIITKPMFIITTACGGGMAAGMALGSLFHWDNAGILLSAVIILVGLWYQIYSTGGLTEKTREPGLNGEAGDGTAGIREKTPGTWGKLPWRVKNTLISAGIAASAVFVLGLFFRQFLSFIDAFVMTFVLGYIWRNNFSGTDDYHVTSEEWKSLGIVLGGTFAVLLLVALLYLSAAVGHSSVMRGYIAKLVLGLSLRMSILALIPVAVLSFQWRKMIRRPVWAPPDSREAINIAIGAAAGAGVSLVMVLIKTVLPGMRFGGVGLVLTLLYGAIQAGFLGYVWGRSGVYKRTAGGEEENVILASAIPAADYGKKAAGVFSSAAQFLQQNELQNSKYRKKTAGAVKISNQEEYWQTAAPLLLTQMTLSEETESNHLGLTLGFQNLTEKTVIAVYVDINCYNVLKEQVAQLKGVHFLDLNISCGGLFICGKPVALPDNSIRRCQVSLRHVVFSDDTIWDGEDGVFCEKLEIQKKLDEGRNMSRELVGEFHRQMSGRSMKNLAQAEKTYRYFPEKRDVYWYCGCGQMNPESCDICLSCGVDREKLFSAARTEFLEAELKLRMEEEQRQREEEERLRAERAAERSRKIGEVKKTAKDKAQNIVIQGKAYYEKGIKKSQGIKKKLEEGADGRAAENTCPNCGAEYADRDLFCKECGHKLK